MGNISTGSHKMVILTVISYIIALWLNIWSSNLICNEAFNDKKIQLNRDHHGLWLDKVLPIENLLIRGPLTSYAKLRVAHALGNAGNAFPATDVPWYMSGSLIGGFGENVPGIPGACTTRNFTYLVRSPLIENGYRCIFLAQSLNPCSYFLKQLEKNMTFASYLLCKTPQDWCSVWYNGK